jgi:hypothetical protein
MMISHALINSGEKKNDTILITRNHSFSDKGDMFLGLNTTLNCG